MLVLNDCSSVGSQSSLLKVWEHVEQVYGGEKLDHSISEEFQALIVSDVGFRYCLLAETRHDIDQRVNACKYIKK
jgi:hypothetical protein